MLSLEDQVCSVRFGVIRRVVKGRHVWVSGKVLRRKTERKNTNQSINRSMHTMVLRTKGDEGNW